MKKILALILALLMVASFVASCDNGQPASSSSATSSSSSTSSSTLPSSSSSSSEDNSPTTPTVSIPKIDYAVNVNQSFNPSSFDLSSFGNTDLASSYPNAKSDDVTDGVHITVPGVYRIYGSSTKDGIKVEIARPDETAALQDVVLILDGAQIQNGADATIAPIYSKGCNLKIILLKDKRNIIFDNRVVNEQTSSEKGAIYVKTGNLTIEGEGELKIDTKYKNAIYCTKSITINGGIFNLTSNYNGIYAGADKRMMDTDSSIVGGLTINSGDFTINSSRSALKAGEYDDQSTPITDIKGKIIVNGGLFKLKSSKNAIDVYGEIVINGGGFDISSSEDGLNATDKITFAGDDKTVMILNTDKTGIKCDALVQIGGNTNIKITTDNDGIEAYDVTVNTQGVLYIVTNPGFIQDEDEGNYIRGEDKKYYRVERAHFPNATFYTPKNSAKGIDAENTITISGGTVAIQSIEDCIVTTDGTKTQNPQNTLNTIVINGGILALDTYESAIKADNSISVSGASTEIFIYRSDKGFNAENVTLAEADVVSIAISDSIDARNATVSSGKVYLFDKVDLENNENNGTVVINGGTIRECLLKAQER